MFVPIATNLWQFYLIRSFNGLHICKWAIVRSFLSKIVEPDELGKVLTGIAVVAGFVPFIKTPLMRETYKATLDFFPGAIFILSGSMILLSFDLNAIFYMKKDKLSSTSESKDTISAMDTTDAVDKVDTGDKDICK